VYALVLPTPRVLHQELYLKKKEKQMALVERINEPTHKKMKS
jgi:hypothetical protein